LIWLHTTILPDLDWNQRQRVSIPLLIEHSLTKVSETTQQALAVVGLLALAPFEAQVITETLAVEANQGLLAAVRKIFQQKSTEQQPDFQRAVIELVNYGLLNQSGRRCQVAHVLVHNYARKHLTAPAKALRRLTASYVALAWEQSALGPEGYAVLDANRPHIMKILTECLQWEDWEAAYSLAAAIEDYLDRQGYWSERVIANEVGLITAWQLGRPNEGAWLSNLGDTYRTMGHARWAIKHFEKALATARQNHDQHSAANSLGNLGLAYRDLGQLDMARQYLEQALTIFEEIRSPSAKFVQDWLNNLEKE
jgi:tetratricopeptide (TPR) repeat protein